MNENQKPIIFSSDVRYCFRRVDLWVFLMSLMTLYVVISKIFYFPGNFIADVLMINYQHWELKDNKLFFFYLLGGLFFIGFYLRLSYLSLKYVKYKIDNTFLVIFNINSKYSETIEIKRIKTIYLDIYKDSANFYFSNPLFSSIINRLFIYPYGNRSITVRRLNRIIIPRSMLYVLNYNELLKTILEINPSIEVKRLN